MAAYLRTTFLFVLLAIAGLYSLLLSRLLSRDFESLHNNNNNNNKGTIHPQEFQRRGAASRSSTKETPYERCMHRLDPEFDPDTEFYLHSRQGKNKTLSLQEAFESDETTIYFLHQRKSGGTSIKSILYDKLLHHKGPQANSTAWVPCFAPKQCVNFELPLYETNYLGSIKLVGAHMSYHTPLARSGFEKQVLITNFREPISRIRSCMLYRYSHRVRNVFGSPEFTMEDGERLLMNQRDAFNSTCIQEPFRILSPLDPDKEPVSQKSVQRICCLVRSSFHVIQTPPPPVHTFTRMTRIEQEMNELMNTKHKMITAVKLPETAERNLERFLEYIRDKNPFVQSEMDLYTCVTKEEEVVEEQEGTTHGR